MHAASNVNPERPSSELLITNAMPADPNVYALIDYRRGQVRRREYRPLGMLEKVMLEKSAVADVGVANPLTHGGGPALSIDYYKTGPLVGITADEQDVLICARMPHPPDLPDPNWRPAYPPTQFKDGIPVPETPPKIEQRLRDRASGVLPAEPPRSRVWLFGRKPDSETSDFWFVFQPVHQVLLILADRTGLAMIECASDANGRHTALLYNPAREEGHLIFGTRRLEFFRA